jgi:hypothetical protein
MIELIRQLSEGGAFFIANAVLAILGLILIVFEGAVSEIQRLKRRASGVAPTGSPDESALRRLTFYVMRAALMSIAISLLISVNSIHSELDVDSHRFTFLQSADDLYAALAADVRGASKSIITTHVRNSKVTLRSGQAYQQAIDDWIKTHPEQRVRRLISAHVNYVDTAKAMLASAQANPNLEVKGIDWPVKTAPMSNFVVLDEKILYVVTYGADSATNSLSQDISAVRISNSGVAKAFKEYFDLLWTDEATKSQDQLIKFYNIESSNVSRPPS